MAIPIRDAAAHQGISENAVRKRITRGTLDAQKVDSEWRVAVAGYPTTSPENLPGLQPTTTANPSDQAALVDQLQPEVEFLRSDLGARREAEREQCIIISQLVGRVEALTSRQDAGPARERAGGDSTTQDDHQPVPQRPWWKFWR